MRREYGEREREHAQEIKKLQGEYEEKLLRNARAEGDSERREWKREKELLEIELEYSRKQVEENKKVQETLMLAL